MESVVTQALVNDEDFEEIFSDRIFAPSSLGVGPIPANPDKPYVLWKELESTAHESVQETSDATSRTFQFFVHDERGDTTRLNEGLRAIKSVVKDVAPYDDETTRISESSWHGESEIFDDVEMGNIVRYGFATFLVNR